MIDSYAEDNKYCIAVAPECDGVGFEAVEVDGDAEWDGNLVSSRVASPDGTGGVVHLVTHLRQRQVSSSHNSGGKKERRLVNIMFMYVVS